MKLSVIILNYNGERFLERCLTSLLNNLPESGNEIILVDNHSSDRSVEIIEKKYKDIRIIKCNRNYGPGGGRNIGGEVSGGEYLLFLDHDTFIKKDTISGMTRVFEDEKVGIVGCKLLNEDGTHQPSAKRFPNLSSEFFSSLLLNRIFKKSNLTYIIQSDKTVDVGWVSGACFMIKKEVFLKVGGFDEDYFYGAEEADLCYRAKMAGWRALYVPEVEAVHVAYGSNLVVTSRIYSNPLKAKIIFFKKHYPGVSVKLLKFLLIIQTINELIVWMILSPIKSRYKTRTRIAIKERIARLTDLIKGRV